MSQYSPNTGGDYRISIQSNSSPQVQARSLLGRTLSTNYLVQQVKGNPKALPQTMKSLNAVNTEVSNVQSRAMKHFLEKQVEEKEDNFSSCFYLNSCRNIENQGNFEMKSIIERYRTEDLAASDVAKDLYERFFRDKFQYSQTIQKSLNTVQLRASSYTNSKKSDKQKEFLMHVNLQYLFNFSKKNSVKKLYQNLKQISEHILNQEGETKFERLNQKLQDKESATIDQLKETTLDQNEKILKNLRMIRVLLSKITDEYEILKEIEQSLKFESENGDQGSSLFKDSEQQETSTNVSTQTKISKYQEEIKSQKKKNEQKKIEKYLSLISNQQQQLIRY